MTDRTRYDRTEEEAPLVPLVRETGRQPNRPTTDRPTIDDQPAERPGVDAELRRELRTLRTQLDRIETTLQNRT